jgi:hypothetical protein
MPARLCRKKDLFSEVLTDRQSLDAAEKKLNKL